MQLEGPSVAVANLEGVTLKQLAQFLAAIVFTVSSFAAAQSLAGTVTNGTTSKPAVGDEVILINLSNGMEVADKTKADAAGKFSFKLADNNGPHLIRAIHQGVTYHQMAPPGTSTVEVKVYDVVRKIADLAMTADVRLFAVNNTSSPAKTQMNDHNFEFYLPDGAKIDSAQAKAPNGQPIAAEATPQSEKNRYAIAFPLRPGETQFQVEYTMSYSGSVKIDPKPLYPAQHVVVVVPKTMHFAAANASQFQSMQDPGQSDTIVQVAQGTSAGQSLPFTISGTGTISESREQVASGAAQEQGQGQSQARDSRPGGGLGAPIDAPDPLQQYRWPILIGFAAIFAVGAWVVMKRQPGAAGVPSTSVPDPRIPTYSPAAPAPAGAAIARSAMLLEALKEEMFQLELEKRQGKLAPAEYEKAKAALDQTLDRALKRQA
ncbi:MAG: hypothetical protein DMG80_13015 [Acidobacteria bacterium]|nr:MAG: hypothetical protein DMG80_13015 [Acidobacteriota bacterium]